MVFFEANLNLHQQFTRNERDQRQGVGQHEEQAQQVDARGQKDRVSADAEKAIADQGRAVAGIDADAPGLPHLRLRDEHPRQGCKQQRPAAHLQRLGLEMRKRAQPLPDARMRDARICRIQCNHGGDGGDQELECAADIAIGVVLGGKNEWVLA